jgi:hypothetical protein
LNFHPPSLLSDLYSFPIIFSLSSHAVPVQNVLSSSAPVSFILFVLICFSSAPLLLRNESMVHRLLCQTRYDAENGNRRQICKPEGELTLRLKEKKNSVTYKMWQWESAKQTTFLKWKSVFTWFVKSVTSPCKP